MGARLALPPEQVQVVHVGIPLDGHEQAPLEGTPPVVGYLSRLAEPLGLGDLVEAFVRLRAHPRLRGLRLRATGGATPDDRRFLRGLRRRIAAAGAAHDVDLLPDFSRPERLRFLHSLDLMCVPAPGGGAFGTYVLEALASGVPVVEPEAGAFPEILGLTGGGLLYPASEPGALARTLESILLDPARRRRLGRQGRAAVHGRFGIDTMAEHMSRLYARLQP
jgi:glycosyltransferase involved in cell wall biosynthesis